MAVLPKVATTNAGPAACVVKFQTENYPKRRLFKFRFRRYAVNAFP
jgi:hypothetical protein